MGSGSTERTGVEYSNGLRASSSTGSPTSRPTVQPARYRHSVRRNPQDQLRALTVVHNDVLCRHEGTTATPRFAGVPDVYAALNTPYGPRAPAPPAHGARPVARAPPGA